MGQGIGAVRRRRPPHGGWLAGLLAGAALAAGVGPATPSAAQGNCAAPNAVGMPIGAAKKVIQRGWSGSAKEITFDVSPAAPAGLAGRAIVAEQGIVRCGGGEFFEPAVVKLTPGAKVPDLVGRTRRDAEATLVQAGLAAHPDPQGAGDLVVGQSPAAGTPTPFGTRVVLRLRQGTGTTGTVSVPDLGGMAEAAARRRLGTELRLVVVQTAGRKPVVIWQDPPPGATAKRGDVVRVRLGERPAGSSTSSSTSSSTGAGGGTGGTGNTGGTDGGGGGGGTNANPNPGPGRIPAPVAALVLAGIAAAIVGGSLLARRPSRRPQRAPGSVHAEPHADPAPDVSAGVATAGPSLTVRLQPHGDPGTQRIGEGPR